MAEADAPTGGPGERDAARALLPLALLVLPATYAGLLGSVFLHEVLGHGGTALWHGGEFDGIGVTWWGGGVALAYAEGAEAAVLLGGSAAEAVAGGTLLLLAPRMRPGGVPRLVLLLLALVSLGCAGTYTCWGAVLDQGVVALAAEHLGGAAFRATAGVGGAALALAAAWFAGAAILREGSRFLDDDAWRTPGPRAAATALLFLPPALAGLPAMASSASWAPGSGVFAAAWSAVHLAVAAAIWRRVDRPAGAATAPPPGGLAIAIAWLVAAGLAVMATMSPFTVFPSDVFRPL